MASKYALADDDRGATAWCVYLDAAQCACGHVTLLHGDEPLGLCPSCWTDDEPASVCALEALVPLDHYGDPDGEIVVRHGYTSGHDGVLGGTWAPSLTRALETWLYEQACGAREVAS